MTKSTTVQRIAAIATAAAVAGVAVVMMPSAPQALTVSRVEGATAPSHLKADRLPLPLPLPLPVTGAACSSHSWPNYDQSCQFDLRRPAGEVRTVRVVALKRSLASTLPGR
jgi:hypothetical protein